MHGRRREGWQANGDVFGPFRPRRAVADPFARLTDDGLAGADFNHAVFVLDEQSASQHDADFKKLRLLPRFFPAAGRDHAGDADLVVARVHSPGELFDLLGLASGSRYAGGLVDSVGHENDVTKSGGGFLPPNAEARCLRHGSTRRQDASGTVFR